MARHGAHADVLRPGGFHAGGATVSGAWQGRAGPHGARALQWSARLDVPGQAVVLPPHCVQSPLDRECPGSRSRDLDRRVIWPARPRQLAHGAVPALWRWPAGDRLMRMALAAPLSAVQWPADL